MKHNRDRFNEARYIQGTSFSIDSKAKSQNKVSHKSERSQVFSGSNSDINNVSLVLVLLANLTY